ncbi:MAG: DNA-3-methyladenine glycosylase 2 family protein [Alphaproteobacteria bacterium]|nr:DNA-3-methyladenine glycosylase 2 family protein [Alphaproteobacteria bacterium]
MKAQDWNKAKAHLRTVCPTMRRIIDNHPEGKLTARPDGFYTLLRAIVGQQISVKAADSIWKRLEAKVKPLSPEKLAKTRISTLHSIGLSEQKAHYAKNVAAFYLKHPRHADGWSEHEDDAIIKQLTEIKGIGRWTAEMFLMFHTVRPDVLPLGDLGLLKAIDLHYPTKRPRKKAHYEQVAEAWKPYRTVATWYLWRSLDPVPVAY